MVDWLHCNTCFHQPGNGTKFLLTSCGHIYCDHCIHHIKNSKCAMCGNMCNTINLSGQMKSDVEVYFTNPMDILKKNLKQIIQVIDFQQSHRKRFVSYLKDKIQKQQNIVQKAQEAVKQYQELDREVNKLKEENSYLKRLINEKGLGNNNRPVSHGRSYSPGYRVSPTYHSPHERGLISRTQSQHSLSSDGSVRGVPSSVGRLSIRSPPSGGRIGITGGMVSPQGSGTPVTPKSVPHPIAFSAFETPSPR